MPLAVVTLMALIINVDEAGIIVDGRHHQRRNSSIVMLMERFINESICGPLLDSVGLNDTTALQVLICSSSAAGRPSGASRDADHGRSSGQAIRRNLPISAPPRLRVRGDGAIKLFESVLTSFESALKLFDSVLNSFESVLKVCESAFKVRESVLTSFESVLISFESGLKFFESRLTFFGVRTQLVPDTNRRHLPARVSAPHRLTFPPAHASSRSTSS